MHNSLTLHDLLPSLAIAGALAFSVVVVALIILYIERRFP